MSSQRWSGFSALLLSFSISACGGGSNAPDLDAGLDASDASTLDASDAASNDASDAELDAGVDAADASDAALPMPVPCAPNQDNVVTLTNGLVRVEYDLDTGTASFAHGGAVRVSSFYSGVQLANYITSKQYSARTCVTTGNETVITNTGNALPVMKQIFVLEGGNKMLVRLQMEGQNLETRWIGPFVMDTTGGVDIGSYGDVRALFVPFDNDAWITYDARSINGSLESYEVSAFYDNVTRNGMVFGSVTHDLWKTGIYAVGSNNRLNALNVYGGATAEGVTRDKVPHGLVRGNVIRSPEVFVGYAADYRDLLEEFAAVNAARAPRLAWNQGVPFGWNSWGKIQTALSYDKAVAVADYIHSALTPNGFAGENGTVYVNLDSYWDNLSSQQLANFVTHVHAQGQKAGIYWSPFVDWGLNASRGVEGTAYTYGQIWLRDGANNPISLDGAYAVDPTHPGTLGRINHFIDQFKAWGFDYVKLDFLTHGALESTVRHDPSIQTGIAAFNFGMRYIVQRIDGTMFISASIAPLFPHGYAHARRVACDTYGAAVGSLSTEYLMNSVTYGWWMSGAMYTYNDPDHMVFEGFAAPDNMMRVISGVISGTVMMAGDDLSVTAGQAPASTYLTNARLNAVARLGRTFRPLEGNTGTGPSDVFVLRHGNQRYVAVFNFSGNTTTRTIDLARAGFDGGAAYTARDLWTNTTSSAQGTLNVQVASHSAKLIALE